MKHRRDGEELGNCLGKEVREDLSEEVMLEQTLARANRGTPWRQRPTGPGNGRNHVPKEATALWYYPKSQHREVSMDRVFQGKRGILAREVREQEHSKLRGLRQYSASYSEKGSNSGTCYCTLRNTTNGWVKIQEKSPLVFKWEHPSWFITKP